MEVIESKYISTGDPIEINGERLSIDQVVYVARGAEVRVCPEAINRVKAARISVEESVTSGKVIYGVNTGFGNNADIVLDDLSDSEKLQENLILTHAVCVGDPLTDELVRAMMLIRINTLLRGHSGIRWILLERLTEMLNEGMLPIIPEKGSVGASGDLAPLSHMALPLIGYGEIRYKGQQMPSEHGLGNLPSNQGRESSDWAFKLSYKEGLALINGTTLMAAYGALIVYRLSQLVDLADVNAALCVDSICGRSAAFREDVHLLRPHPGQLVSAAHLRMLLKGSTLMDAEFELIPTSSGTWTYHRAKGEVIMRGGKPPRPQDSYSIRCVPQVHGAVRDALRQAERVLKVELNAVTDNPLLFPHLPIETRFASAGHFHGMPIAMALSYLKIALPTLASISERRLNKLVDPATNDGLPAFLVQNLDGSESGYMIIQYTAAALVNELASKAHPTTVYSIPTSANTEDHVSMGTNEGRQVLDMLNDLCRVLGLELITAAQALEMRMQISAGHYWSSDSSTTLEELSPEIKQRRERLLHADLRPSPLNYQTLKEVRKIVKFLDKDRALSRDVQQICKAVIHDPERFTRHLSRAMTPEVNSTP